MVAANRAFLTTFGDRFAVVGIADLLDEPRDISGATYDLRIVPLPPSGTEPPLWLVSVYPRPAASQIQPDGWVTAALDAFPHKVWVVHADGLALYANRAMTEYLGRPLPIDRASRDQVIIHPADYPLLARNRSAARAEGTNFEVDVRLPRHDGNWRWHHMTVTIIGGPLNNRLWLVLATDVHELRLATDRLRSAEERLTLAQSIGRIGIWDWDLVTGETVNNDVYFDLIGVPPAARHGFDDILTLVHEDDRADVEQAIHATLNGAVDYRIEFRVRRPDGLVRWLSARGAVLHDETGRPVRFLGVMVDITENREAVADRERLMRQIADQLAELESLYDTAPVGLGLLDRDFCFQRLNARLADINGYSVDEHLGRTAWDLVPDLRSVAEPLLRRVLATGETLSEVEITGTTPAAPGVVRHWIEQFYPLRDSQGMVRGVGITCEEVTDRKAAERRLKASEQRLRLATEAAEIGVFEWDPATETSLYVNSRMQEVLGGDPTVDRLTFLEERVHPDDRPALEAAFREEVRVAGQAVRTTARIRRSGQLGWRHVEFAGEFVADDDGQVRFLGVARDVTALKQAEETHTLLVAELNHRVKNTLATVQAIASQTLRKARSPDVFVEDLKGRLQALSRAHNLLTEATWTGADITRLITEQTAMPELSSSRLVVSGPSFALTPQVALRLGLVLHELATNARKYGALATTSGQVQIAWRHAPENGRDQLALDWREAGGPPVKPPDHRGFGTRLIEASMTALDGQAELDFAPTGLTCRLRFPLA